MSNVFWKAKEIIEREGWIDFSPSFVNPEGSSKPGYCILAACSIAAYDDPELWVEFMEAREHEILLGVILENYPGTPGIYDRVWIWNDTIAESQDEVVAMLEKAAVKLDEQI